MLNDKDYELLEAYLDDDLSSELVHRLDSRLSAEPALAAALDAFRQGRALRSIAFQALAPDDAEAERFADAVIASVGRAERTRRRARYSAIASAVAACVLAGFGAGWLGHHSAPAYPQLNAVAPRSHVDARLVIHKPSSSDTNQYQVALLDDDGNVVAVQKFASLSEARQFADDLGKFEARRQQMREGRPMLVSDRF